MSAKKEKRARKRKTVTVTPPVAEDVCLTEGDPVIAPPPAQDPETGRFVTGNSGGGRPKGSRNKLGEQFLTDLQADWAEHGASAIKTVRTERPHEYLKVVASILPKELNVRVDPLEEIDDDELTAILVAARAARRLHQEGGGDVGEAPGGKPSGVLLS